MSESIDANTETGTDGSSPSVALPERRRAMEDMSKDQLIAMFQKFRSQAGLLASEKKHALDMFEACSKEKDELVAKAKSIIKRMRELEERQHDYDALKLRLLEFEKTTSEVSSIQ